MKIARPRKWLPDQPRPNYHSIVPLDQLAIGLLGEDQLRESGHQQGIQNSQQDRRRDGHEYRCNKIFLHCSLDSILSIPDLPYISLTPVINMSISLMPMNGTTSPPNP